VDGAGNCFEEVSFNRRPKYLFALLMETERERERDKVQEMENIQ